MIAGHARIVVTANVADWSADSEPRLTWIARCLARHTTQDWGDLDPDDRCTNNRAVRDRQGGLLSRYRVPPWIADDANDDAMWIITDDLDDPDTATTILWPSDY
jgi:hypothetical protein